MMPSIVLLSGLLTFSISNGPGGIRDWIGLYQVGAGNSSYIDWNYLASGTKNRPAAGVTSGTVKFRMPTIPGTYEARFLSVSSNGTFTLLSTGAPIVVGIPSPVTVNLLPSDSVTIPDNTPAGAKVAAVSVIMSDGSKFAGRLNIDDNRFVMSGMNIVTARVFTPSDDGKFAITVTASQ